MPGSRLLQGSLVIGALWMYACAPAPAAPVPAPAPPASQVAIARPPELAEEAEPVVRELRTGRIDPIDHDVPLQLKVRRHAVDGEEQLIELALPEFASEVPGDVFWLGTEARISGGSAPFQLVGRGKSQEMMLWLRRPKGELASEIMGDAYTASMGARPGHHFRFRAPPPTGAASPELAVEWAQATIEYLFNGQNAFGASAAARLQARYKLPVTTGTALPGGAAPSELMDTFTGRSAVQFALAMTRRDVVTASRQPRNVPLAQLEAPALSRHPWAELSKRLNRRAPDEPLARAVPADFYFGRAKSFSAFIEVLSLVERFSAPSADALDDTLSDQTSMPRYLAELGMETGDLSRVLGPEVVEDFALTGSDPYLREGSDVTLIFRLKSPLLFRAALLKALATHSAAHGGTQASSFVHEGVTVDVARSPDGRVRRHHAVIGELELVSNSSAAIKRVISTIQGKAPRLADEPDFHYMLARDADVPADVLGFIGDRFVEKVVGPAQKLAQSRRQVALNELTAAPVAALLYGWVHGKSPADKNELIRSGLLAAAELKHRDGTRIDWAPGSAPRSLWGTPAALEPLIDLPAVTMVSNVERDSYSGFARRYEQAWNRYIDPIAVRLSSARRGEGKGLHAEMRVLPLVPAEEAARFDLGGDGRIAPPELASGARFGIGLGAQSPLRRELSGWFRWASAYGPNIELDWLGDYAMVGCADRTELLAASRASSVARHRSLERPASTEDLGREEAQGDGLESLPGLPVYAVVGLRSRVATVVALSGVRQVLESVAPGEVKWAPFATHRGVEVVRISARERGHEIALYYALAGDALIATFNRSVMRTLIEQALDGKLPVRGKAAAAAQGQKDGQVVLELAPSKKGSLRTLLAWALTGNTHWGALRTRPVAEAVLRGVPESAHDADRSAQLSRAYLGTAPLTPDGRHYRLSPEGIADPLRGTAHAPAWPALPTPGSSAEKVLTALSRVRSDLSFDEEPHVASNEPPLRSLRVRLDLWLR